MNTEEFEIQYLDNLDSPATFIKSLVNDYVKTNTDNELPFGSELLGKAINKIKSNPKSPNNIAYEIIFNYKNHDIGDKFPQDKFDEFEKLDPYLVSQSYFDEAKEHEDPIGYMVKLADEDEVFKQRVLPYFDFSSKKDKDDDKNIPIGDKIKAYLTENGMTNPVSSKDTPHVREIPKGDRADKGLANPNIKSSKVGTDMSVGDTLRGLANYGEETVARVIDTDYDPIEDLGKKEKVILKKIPVLRKLNAMKYSEPRNFSIGKTEVLSAQKINEFSAIGDSLKKLAKGTFDTALNVINPDYNPNPKKLSTLDILATGGYSDFSSINEVLTQYDQIRKMFGPKKSWAEKALIDLTGIGADEDYKGTFKETAHAFNFTLPFGLGKANFQYSRVNPYNPANAKLTPNFTGITSDGSKKEKENGSDITSWDELKNRIKSKLGKNTPDTANDLKGNKELVGAVKILLNDGESTDSQTKGILKRNFGKLATFLKSKKGNKPNINIS